MIPDQTAGLNMVNSICFHGRKNLASILIYAADIISRWHFQDKKTLARVSFLSIPRLEFQESDVSPAKTEVKQNKFVEFISQAKGYFRETHKSQNIKHISPTPKLTIDPIPRVDGGWFAGKTFATVMLHL